MMFHAEYDERQIIFMVFLLCRDKSKTNAGTDTTRDEMSACESRLSPRWQPPLLAAVTECSENSRLKAERVSTLAGSSCCDGELPHTST